ncbi:Gfo/Idh/MocA family protein [Radiobacillus sp. PE A8.2]|uniref:Gfo/Idh/MocA family protein n=1 Tax=Radiobacillus sp. PE A8.2 TaxID=3380349 RepID=UPI00388DEF6E
MEKLNWGIMSTAGIGQTQVIPAIQRSNNGIVQAIASRGDKAREVATALNIPKAYSSYEQLLDDPEIQAVYIPLPNSLHKEWVIKAAESGKHVLCEKPAALNPDELVEMIQACRNNQVIFMEAFMYQFHPQHGKVKELIESGAVGDVSFMRASFSYFMQDRDTNIRMNRELGGGSLYDIGCYSLHSICNILNMKPTNIFASAKVDPRNQVDTNVAGTLSFNNGVQASFDCSFDLTSRNSYQVVGSKGSIEVNGAFRPDQNENEEGRITVQTEDGMEEFFIQADQYKLQVENFASAIFEGKQPSYTNEMMLDHALVVDACLKSIDTRESVSL